MTKKTGWCKVDTNLKSHPKMRGMARRCKIKRGLAAGQWLFLLGHVKNVSPLTGEIPVGKDPISDVADYSDVDGPESEQWYNALLAERLVDILTDDDGHIRLYVHDFMDWYETDIKAQENSRETTQRWRTNKTIREAREMAETSNISRASRNKNVTTWGSERPKPIRDASPLRIVTSHDSAGDGVRIEETRVDDPVVRSGAPNSQQDETGGMAAQSATAPRKRTSGSGRPTKAQQARADFAAEMADGKKPGARERNEQAIRDGTCPPVTEFTHRVTIHAGLDYHPNAVDRGALVEAKENGFSIADIAACFVAVGGNPQTWGDRWNRLHLSVHNAIKWLPAYRIEMQRRGNRNGSDHRGAGAMAGRPAGAVEPGATREDRHAADAERRGRELLEAEIARLAREGGVGAGAPEESHQHADA